MTEYLVPQMVTIQKASELTGLSYNFLRKGCLNGEIVHIRSGAKFLINLNKLIDKLNGEGE